MAVSFFFLMSALLLSIHSSILVCHSSWDEVSNLDTLDSKQVKAFISPLVGASTNAYSYPGLQPISNWTLASKVEPLAPKQEAGVHALLYEQVQEQKLVLAFRGSYTQADSCVDLFLFGEASVPRGVHLPSKESCNARFSNASLDYISQAVNYTESVVRAYPATPLLLTGHSLGAALAILVSASLSKQQVLPVVGFSSPATRGTLQEKSLKLVAEQQNQVFVFGNEWDPVMRKQWKQQVGTVCSLEYGQPQACAACSSSSGGGDNDCKQCIFEAHGLDHILQILDDGKSKLVCEKNLSTSQDPLEGAATNSGFMFSIDLFFVLVVACLASGSLLLYTFDS